MTPEERAGQVLHDYEYSPYGIEYLIAKAIRAAIEAEREACARFVEDGADGWAGRDFRDQIAAAIRARAT